MLKDAAVVSKKVQSIKNKQDKIQTKLGQILVSRTGDENQKWRVNFLNDPLTMKLYFMYFYFSSFCKRPKQTISVDFDSRNCLLFDQQRDFQLFKENLAKVEENLKQKGFKTKLKAYKNSYNPKYKLTISTRENFK